MCELTTSSDALCAVRGLPSVFTPPRKPIAAAIRPASARWFARVAPNLSHSIALTLLLSVRRDDSLPLSAAASTFFHMRTCLTYTIGSWGTASTHRSRISCTNLVTVGSRLYVGFPSLSGLPSVCISGWRTTASSSSYGSHDCASRAFSALRRTSTEKSAMFC